MVSHNFSVDGNAAIFSPEKGDSMFLRNVGIYPRFYKAPQPIFTSVITSDLSCAYHMEGHIPQVPTSFLEVQGLNINPDRPSWLIPG
jgi:hypothetical protein